MTPKYIIGFEGSANKLGVSIITSDFRILSNRRLTYIPDPGQGFQPAEICSHHSDNISNLTKEVLNESKISLDQIDVIAYTRGPGIASALNSVSIFVRSLAMHLKIPVVPVNHCIAHIEMGVAVTKSKNPLILYISGGNSQIIYYSNKRYRILGETIDSAIGNVIDRVGRKLNISNNPCAGYNIELLARKYENKIKNPNKKLKCENSIKEESIYIPCTEKGFDFGFSGINEFVDNYINKSKSLLIEKNNKEKTFELPENEKEKICFYLQENLFGLLLKQCDKIISYLKRVIIKKGGEDIDGVLVTGGVGCNMKMQEMLGKLCEKWKIKLFGMDERYCIDNGAMISWTGWLLYRSGISIEHDKIDVTQRFRTDSVEILWKNDLV